MEMKPLLEAVYAKEKDIVTRSVAGETILVPIRGRLADMQRLFALDDVGAFVWRRLEGRQTLGSICEGVVEEYAVDFHQAAADVREFVAQLLSAGLVALIEKQP
jgi:hypothetical protein